jgi:hypothetical protein
MEIADLFDLVWDFVTQGIFDLVKDAIIWMMGKLMIFYFEAAAASVEFGWEIASGVVNDLNLSAEIIQAFGDLSPTSTQALAFFRIPECINTVLSALGTRFVLKFIPFV